MGELINFRDIIFHIINLILLVVAARFLLYKPVMKFMKDRAERFSSERAELDAARKELADARAKADEIVADAKAQAIEYSEAQKLRAETQAEKILDDARALGNKEAKQIIRDAELQAEANREAKQQEIIDSAVELAGRILEREISVQDDGKLIEDFIDKDITKSE